jgi:Cof subfamily protein (haloacid dehalogenase superfamily)
LPLKEEELIKKLRNVKLVVSDVDGTLVSTDYRLSKNLIKVVDELKNKGILFTIASQRVLSSLVPIARQLSIDIPMISLNGSLISDIRGKDTLFTSYLKESIVKNAIRLSGKSYVKIAFSVDDRILYSEDNSVFRDFFPIPDAIYETISDYGSIMNKVLRIYVLGNDKKSILNFKKKIRPLFNFSLKVNYHRSQTHNKVYKLEIYNNDFSKKTALKYITSHLGLKKEELAVIGDWYNDMELFDFGAVNVTLKNGLKELKNKADYISGKSNDEGGVDDFLEILLKAKSN